MDLKTKLLEIMQKAPKEFYSEDRLANMLGITSKVERAEIGKVIDELLHAGDIVFDRNRKFLLLEGTNLQRGRLSGNPKGFAFFRPEKEGVMDMFIPNKNLNGAFHEDIVLCGLASEDREGDVGFVHSILKRGITELVGTYKGEKSCGFVIPDDGRFHSDIYVPKARSLNARTGMKVVVRITEYPEYKKNPEGQITELLGKSTDVGTDVLSIIRGHGIKAEFEKSTMQEAERVPQIVDEGKLAKRKDFRNIDIVTIDGEDARDLDDAISISKNPDGSFTLGVHIADVSEYVKEGMAIDDEARDRATSVYFVDRVVPMLPKELSNGICSLNENVDRLTLSLIMEIDRSGNVTSHELSEGVIRTASRMTYTSVAKMIDGDTVEIEKNKKVLPLIKNMEELANILIKKRGNEGNIDFETPEAKIILDELGKVVEIKKYDRTLANRLIEEFMILANRTVAERMFFSELPCIYRIHQNPDGEKMENFEKFVNALGVSFKLPTNKLHSKDLAKLLDTIDDKGVFVIVNKVLLRSMQKAKYSKNDSGHFGLSLEHYCHFTSPIRRYPDLFTHRMIKKMLHGELDERNISLYDNMAAEIAENASLKEKEADEAERESDDLKKTEYMATMLGEVFDGVISGVTSFGIFVELDNTCEGLIRMETMPTDNYFFDEKMYTLRGAMRSFKLGEKVRIKVVGADVKSKKVSFVLAQ